MMRSRNVDLSLVWGEEKLNTRLKCDKLESPAEGTFTLVGELKLTIDLTEATESSQSSSSST